MDKQTIPSNWDSDGVSQGKSTGPVRPTRDAYQPAREEKKEKGK